MTTIYLITQHESEGYCGISGNWFMPEAYNIETEAKARLEELKKELGKYSGLYYDVDAITLR